MRYLSEQNRKLMDESGNSRGRFTKESEKLKQTYQTEMRQLRQLLDECERDKAESLAKTASLQQNLRHKQDQWVSLFIQSGANVVFLLAPTHRQWTMWYLYRRGCKNI